MVIDPTKAVQPTIPLETNNQTFVLQFSTGKDIQCNIKTAAAISDFIGSSQNWTLGSDKADLSAWNPNDHTRAIIEKALACPDEEKALTFLRDADLNHEELWMTLQIFDFLIAKPSLLNLLFQRMEGEDKEVVLSLNGGLHLSLGMEGAKTFAKVFEEGVDDTEDLRFQKIKYWLERSSNQIYMHRSIEDDATQYAEKSLNHLALLKNIRVLQFGLMRMEPNAMVAKLLQLPLLTTLEIQYAIKVKGEHVTQLLKGLPHLSKLSLKYCLLLNNLKIDRTLKLQELDLCESSTINDQDLLAITSHSPYLKRLGIQGCYQISESCIEKILANNKEIVEIDCRGCINLRQALEANPKRFPSRLFKFD